MAISFPCFSFWPLVWPGLLVVLLYYLVPYLWVYRHLRAIPAPFPAQFTNLWLMCICRQSKRSDTVYELHERLGPVLRIQPNHVSIADEKAISLVYGHGNGLEKSDWYDASISMTRSIFTARKRAEHARKRRYISHSFAPKSARAAEPCVAEKVKILVAKWDQIVDGESDSGYGQVDCRRWFTFMSFDITGELLFSEPLGMLEAGSDLVKVGTRPDGKPVLVSMMKSLAQRSAAVATLGVLPWLRPHASHLPDAFFSDGMDGLRNLMGIVMAHVRDRKDNPRRHDDASPSPAEDWLSLLLQARDDKGEPLRLEEITSEGLTIFIAAIETVSNTLSAMMYFLASSPDALRKVQAEVDSAVAQDAVVPSFESVRGLRYLDAVINETMRLLSVIGLGLPREVPPGSGGHRFGGFYFAPGTVLSVPIYTIHRLKEIWGPDSDQFRPERFFDLSGRQRAAFIPFGAGPAACVGRNLAEVEMKVIAATWIRRYAVCRTGEGQVRWTEGTTRKFLSVDVGIKRREAAAKGCAV